MNSNDYGFFCDLENANTMEYDHVDYYVVKVKTRYEVRRMRIITDEPEPIPDIPVVEPTPDKKFGLLERLYNLPSDIYYSFMVCTVTASCVYLVMTI